MIPILYESTETVFTNNGLGRLADTIEAKVSEERNGIYELELIYPMDGEKFSEITEGRIIAVTHDENGDIQPFDIYGHSAPIDGKVTFYAHHISYRQAGLTIKPFTANTCLATLGKFETESVITNPFTYWTDKAVSADYTLSVPKPLNSLLKGDEDSILSVFGTGEYEFDKFTVKLYTNRGTDTDVSIRYGKNLVDLKDDIDFSDAFNGIVPYWTGQDENGNDETVTLTEWVLYKSGATYDGRNTVIPLDLSSEFEEKPTENELRTKANSYLSNNDPKLPINTLTVDFVQLWQTEEYKDFAPLQKVKLCDTVKVIFPKLNIDTRLKVIKVVWNVLLDRYDEIQLGDTPITYAQAITSRLAEQNRDNRIHTKWANGKATDALRIASNTDQYFWFTGTGTDTGAHITEKPKEEFIVDPTNGGWNFLARSNGAAVRNGLTEFARFGANGTQVGKDNDCNAKVLPNGYEMTDYENNTYAEIKDLRERNAYGTPVGTFTDYFTGNGSNKTFYFTLYNRYPSTQTQIYVNGSQVTPSSVGNTSFTLSTAPTSGAEVKAVYQTDSTDAKYFTFGTRQAGTLGPYSFTFGKNNIANAYYSGAMGRDNTVSKYSSLAIGNDLTVNDSLQLVIGELNQPKAHNDYWNDYAFIIGNGWDGITPHNALAVTRSGDIVMDTESNVSWPDGSGTAFDFVKAIKDLGWDDILP